MKWIMDQTNSCFVCMIFFISSRINDIREWIYKIYDSSDIMRNTCDIVHYQIHSLYSCVVQQRIEPSEDAWICISSVEPAMASCDIESTKYTYNSKYQYLQQHEVLDNKMLEIYNKTYHFELGSPNMNELDKIIIMKFKNNNETMYICRKCCAEGAASLETEARDETALHKARDETALHKAPSETALHKSRVKFMSIEYSNPNMDHRLELFVSRDWFVNGNELFTPTHVLHMLEHQSETYIFDMDYTIKILDSNINEIELNKYNYLKLMQNEYKIIPHM